MQRDLFDGQHEYVSTPRDFSTMENDGMLAYDQFIKLRDTLVYSNKYYASNAGRSLIIGTKLDGTPTNTIEVREPNMFYQTFSPGGTVDSSGSTGKYVATGGHTQTNNKSCEIVKTGRYRLQHKEQFSLSPSTTRVHSYILHHHGGTEQQRAVFDWEWSTQGEIKRLTAFGYVECNLEKGDWLELKVESVSGTSIISQMVVDSNWWMVEYIDLAY